jgi:hypothetical protein
MGNILALRVPRFVSSIATLTGFTILGLWVFLHLITGCLDNGNSGIS